MVSPRVFNAAADLIDHNLKAGRGGKLAYIDDTGRATYDELARRVARFANGLAGLGIRREQRILLRAACDRHRTAVAEPAAR